MKFKHFAIEEWKKCVKIHKVCARDCVLEYPTVMGVESDIQKMSRFQIEESVSKHKECVYVGKNELLVGSYVTM